MAAALALQVTVAVTGAVLLQPDGRMSTSAGGQAPARASNTRGDLASRTTAVTELLEARSTAVLQHDRERFLATVDPEATAFRARQAAVIDALGEVPLASWSYDLDPDQARPSTPALEARYPTDWWAPNVTLRYALAAFDRTPTLQPQGLTFVQRGEHWYVGADDDFDDTSHATGRELWDSGPVIAARGRACLVLGHPARAQLVRSLVSDCDAAVPRVTAVWGSGWAQRVVLMVPDDAAELATIVPDSGDLSQIAAVATAELVAPATGYHPVGDRVLVNPANFVELGTLGRRVVLTHEVTHVASRQSTGPQVPTWFVEGLADYVGYQGVRLPLSVSAQELRVDIRAGRVPSRLPPDSAFDGGRKDLAQTYEQSWLAVVLMVRTYGQGAVLRLYRDVGADATKGALDRAVQRDLGTTVAALTGLWTADLKRRLS